MADTNTGSESNDMLEKLVERGMRELDKADRNTARNGGEEKTVKLLGVVEVPEMFATVAEGLWNEGSAEFTRWIQKGSFSKFEKLAKTLGVSAGAETKVAAGATIALTTALKSALYVNPVFNAFREKHQQTRELTKKLAPALAEMNKHTLSGIKEEDNEVVFYARKRLALTTGAKIANNVTKLIVNVVPSLMLEFPNHKRLWNGAATVPSTAVEQGIQGWGGKITRIGSAPVANALNHSRDRRLNNQIATSYSAAELITELAGQLESNPRASSFQLPGRGAKTLSLEKYIEHICETHQKNMVEIGAKDHVEIRPALKEDLTAAGQTLAKSLRAGDLDAMALIRLVGTGKIIKKQGRVIAGVDEIEELLEKETKRPTSRGHVDVKLYYKDKPYTPEQNKEALHTLEGVERALFIAMQPDDVLRKAGLTDKEIGEARGMAKEHGYDQFLAEAILGLEAQIPEIRESLIAHSEIKKIEKYAAAITDKGVEAVHDLKASPINAQGVEEIILNAAVATISGKKTSFGKIIEAGHQRFEQLQTEKAEDKPHDTDRRPSSKHLEEKEKYGDGFHAREQHRDAGRSPHQRGE